MALVARRALAARVRAALRVTPIVAMLGPRQCGKTTLARQLTRGAATRYFDLKDPVAEVQLGEPMTTLAPLRGLVVIDEVQRAPGLFPVLRLQANPKLGASWEGFVLEQVLASVGDRSAYYWGTQSGAELDLLCTIKGRRYGVEVKYADAPRATRSMRVAMTDLALARLYVAYPGTVRYGLADGIEAMGVPELLGELASL